MWGFMVAGCRVGVRVLHRPGLTWFEISAAQKEGASGLYYQLSQVRAEEDEGGMVLESCLQTNIKKWNHTILCLCFMASASLIGMFLYLLTSPWWKYLAELLPGEHHRHGTD